MGLLLQPEPWPISIAGAVTNPLSPRVLFLYNNLDS